MLHSWQRSSHPPMSHESSSRYERSLCLRAFGERLKRGQCQFKTVRPAPGLEHLSRRSPVEPDVLAGLFSMPLSDSAFHLGVADPHVE